MPGTQTPAAHARELFADLDARLDKDRALAERVRDALLDAQRAPKGSNRRARPVLDPAEVYRNDPAALRSALEALDVEELKDIVSHYAMDPRRLALKWKKPERLVDLILTVTEQRARKGDAFRTTPAAPEPRWRRTVLSLGQIRCDLCGRRADTAHVLSEGDYPQATPDAPIEIKFACPAHDAGGYSIELKDWLGSTGQLRQHVEQKVWGPAASAAMDARIDALLREAAVKDRTTT